MMMSGGSGSSSLTGLASGTYYVVYTFTYPSDAETFASQPSNTFMIGQGQLATVILPPLPPGASGINLYVSANGAPPTRYYTGVTETNWHPVSGPVQTLFNMIFPYTPGGAVPPVYNLAPITPKVNVVGGNAYGGNLLPGTYYLYYTFTYAGGVQSTVSPASANFTVAPGNIPQVSLPTLPPGATGYDIYLSDPVANAGLGDLVRVWGHDDDVRSRRITHCRAPPSHRRSTSQRRHRRSRHGRWNDRRQSGAWHLYPLLHIRQRGGGRDVRQPVFGAVHGDSGRDPAGHAATSARRRVARSHDGLQHLPVRPDGRPDLGRSGTLPGSRHRHSIWRSPRQPATRYARRSRRPRPSPRWCRPSAAAQPAANWRRAPITFTTPTPIRTVPRRPRARIRPTSPWPPDIFRS